MPRTIFLTTLVLIAMASLSQGCQKKVPLRSFGPWEGELTDMISQDLTQKYWLTGKVSFGEWKNPLAPSVLKAMGAPEFTSITVRQKGEPTEWSGLMGAEIVITFKAHDGDYTVDADFNMPIRGKNWFVIRDTDWSTGNFKYYDARDNYISVITGYMGGPTKQTSFKPVSPRQIENIPADAYKDLTYRWEKDILVIRDLREKKQYRFKGSGKKEDPYGTVQVSPLG